MTTTTAAAPSRPKWRLWLMVAALFLLIGLVITVLAVRGPGGVRWTLVTPGVAGARSGPLVAEVSAELAADGLDCEVVMVSHDVNQIAFLRREISKLVIRVSRRKQPADLQGLRYTLFDAAGEELSEYPLDRCQSRQEKDGTVIEIHDSFAAEARKVLVRR